MDGIAAISTCAVLLVTGCGIDSSQGGVWVGEEPKADAGQSRAADGDAARSGQSTDGRVIPRNETSSGHTEDIGKLIVRIATLSCSEDCADVEVVVSGGNPPYAYTWDDGSSDRKRRVCVCLAANQDLTVVATDTDIAAGEFGYAAQTASAELSTVALQCGNSKLACADASVPPVGVPPSTGMTCPSLEPSPACQLAGGVSLPEDLTIALIDEARYFGGGAPLPAGRYRLTYVDGCFTYGDPAQYGWTVHFLKASGNGCSLIDADAKPLMFTPGVEGQGIPPALDTYAHCVAANCKEQPIDFDFAGGKLGLMRNGGTPFAEFDDLDGTSAGGRGATFRLTRLDACP